MSGRLTESLTLPAAGRWETRPMTTRTQQLSARRWVLVFLAALVTVLATILSAATASAATTGAAETRVRASSVVVEVPVGPPEHIAAGQRLGEAAPGVDAVVTGVAANGVNENLRGGMADTAIGQLERFVGIPSIQGKHHPRDHRRQIALYVQKMRKKLLVRAFM